MSDHPPKTTTIISNALWHNNPALVQLLGLCPLLGVSNSVVNATGLGLATIAVLGLSSFSVALSAPRITNTVRLPAFMMIIASFTTCIELLMQAYTYELYTVLGIFIPIIVTNCAILGRAESFARRHGVVAATVDGAACAVGFALVLVLLGAIRELLGQGTLFADMHLLLGEGASGWRIDIPGEYRPILVAILPPGAFISVGLLIALHTHIDDLVTDYRREHAPKVAAGSKRVRVTGNISAN